MRRIGVALLIALGLAAAIYFWRRAPTVEKTEKKAAQAIDLEPMVVATAILPPATSEGARFIAFGALGRGKTAEGRLVAPSSFLADGEGLTVLDQENGRIVLGDGASIPLPGKHADDIARTKDGFAVLDRTDGKEVVLLDRSGRVRGRITLAGTGIDDPRDVSRMIVSGGDVLVERNGGGPLLRIGGADGMPAKERTEIQGIPTRDGKSLVSAGITSEDQGRAWITLAGTDAVHRWTRELHFPAELTAVAFLDSDANGTIWSVLLAGSSAADHLNWAVCLDPETGKMRGSFPLRVENPPWESFRDFAVQDGAGLVVATRTDTGVSYATYRCP